MPSRRKQHHPEYVATVERPTKYQTEIGTRFEIVVKVRDGQINLHSRKVVASILRAAKKWDIEARKFQDRVLIHEKRIDKVRLEFWLYQNFRDLRPAGYR